MFIISRAPPFNLLLRFSPATIITCLLLSISRTSVEHQSCCTLHHYCVFRRPRHCCISKNPVDFCGIRSLLQIWAYLLSVCRLGFSLSSQRSSVCCQSKPELKPITLSVVHWADESGFLIPKPHLLFFFLIPDVRPIWAIPLCSDLRT